MKENKYIAIDLKSFYASVECVDRAEDPLNTNLVVADPERTEKTICLAVSPSLKAYGIPGRARLFEVIQKIRDVNRSRESQSPAHALVGKSVYKTELDQDLSLAADYIVAPPRMARYIEVSSKIYKIYLKYVAPEDIHVYSIDEVFIDVTHYLKTYQMDAHTLTRKMVQEVLKETGITATAGIGTNLYLAKVAMDIVAKHVQADQDGVRIAELDEMSYRKLLWDHKPLTDFWRVGDGYARKLQEVGIYTMGDIARCSVGQPEEYYNEDLLYKFFGVNAELLIDHAWGWEPCTMEEVKAYKPEVNCISSGQVLHCPYTVEKARIIAKEMADMLALDLVDNGLVTDQIVLTVGYDITNLTGKEKKSIYTGKVRADHYGRKVPEHAHGTVNLEKATSSTNLIVNGVMKLFDSIVDESLLIRRINITANHIIQACNVQESTEYKQMDLFTDYVALERGQEEEKKALEKEQKLQKAILSVKKCYGKNAMLRGMNFVDGATARDRNRQIGGHRA